MPWEIGQVINNRWIIHRVLKGGMGLIYIVFDSAAEFREVFAAKTFNAETFQRYTGLRDSFISEASAWIALDRHPNITRARYIQSINGDPFLFAEYVDGGDLSQWVGSPRLVDNPELVLELAFQFCDGMLHAASRGLTVHRDIKPQNCLITKNGTLKIADFGLAKAQIDRIRQYKSGRRLPTGASFGTPTHMAPEQFVDAHGVDARADIYSFGVLLYQLLSGRLPFNGASWMELSLMHQKAQPRPLKTRVGELDQLILECLNKDPEDRPDSFGELRTRLEFIYQLITQKPPPVQLLGEPLTAYDLCNKGGALASLGYLDDATKALNHALSIMPEDAYSWLNLGTVFHSKGNFARAIEYYNKGLSINPSIAQAHHNIALAFLALKNSEDAERALKSALKLDPHLADSLIELGRIEIQRANLALGVKYFQSAIAAAPNNAEIITKYGAALAQVGNFSEAIRIVDTSLRINGNQPSAWINRGVAQEGLNDFAGALQSYSNAIELSPTSVEAWMNKGNALFHMERFQDAIGAYNQATNLDAANGQLWVNKGICYTELKEFSAALPCFEKAQELGHPGGQSLVESCKKALS